MEVDQEHTARADLEEKSARPDAEADEANDESETRLEPI